MTSISSKQTQLQPLATRTITLQDRPAESRSLAPQPADKSELDDRQSRVFLAEIEAILADPNASLEDKISALLAKLMASFDQKIGAQIDRVRALQAGNAEGAAGESIDVAVFDLQRLSTKRNQMFETLTAIVERYQRTADSVIQDLSR